MATTDSSLRGALQAVWKRGALALVASVATNALLIWAADTAGLVSPVPPLAYGPVSLLTTVGVVGASVFYAVLDWQLERPARPFALITAVVLLLSFLPNLLVLPSQPGVSAGVNAVLMLMHVVVTVICYVSLTR